MQNSCIREKQSYDVTVFINKQTNKYPGHQDNIILNVSEMVGICVILHRERNLLFTIFTYITIRNDVIKKSW